MWWLKWAYTVVFLAGCVVWTGLVRGEPRPAPVTVVDGTIRVNRCVVARPFMKSVEVAADDARRRLREQASTALTAFITQMPSLQASSIEAAWQARPVAVPGAANITLADWVSAELQLADSVGTSDGSVCAMAWISLARLLGATHGLFTHRDWRVADAPSKEAVATRIAVTGLPAGIHQLWLLMGAHRLPAIVRQSQHGFHGRIIRCRVQHQADGAWRLNCPGSPDVSGSMGWQPEFVGEVWTESPRGDGP